MALAHEGLIFGTEFNLRCVGSVRLQFVLLRRELITLRRATKPLLYPLRGQLIKFLMDRFRWGLLRVDRSFEPFYYLEALSVDEGGLVTHFLRLRQLLILNLLQLPRLELALLFVEGITAWRVATTLGTSNIRLESAVLCFDLFL